MAVQETGRYGPAGTSAPTGTGEFGTNPGRTVKEIPVPVALIGVGVAWLMGAAASVRPPRPPAGTTTNACRP